jgi:hypothetical protein
MEQIYCFLQENETWSAANFNSCASIIFIVCKCLPSNMKESEAVVFVGDINVFFIKKNANSLKHKI